MLNLDENALICDLAETYQIYDYRSLPAFTVATLSAGLRENSRIMTAMRGGILVPPEKILAMIYDLLLLKITGGQAEMYLQDAMDGAKPEKKGSQGNAQGFGSPEEYEQARRKAVGEH